MQSDFPYYCLLVVSIGVMLSHGLKANKQSINYLVVIFSASLCMVATQQLSVERLGHYHYLIGLATCATCNMVWLIARTLFRPAPAITRRHIALAVIIAGLVMFNQTWHMVVASNIEHMLSTEQMMRLKNGMNEITTLLSSSILALSFWESLRHFTHKTRRQKRHAMVFASAFFLGVFNASVLPKFLFSQQEIADYSPWIVSVSAIMILLAIQYVYLASKTLIKQSEVRVDNAVDNLVDRTVDVTLVEGIQHKVMNDKLYLQPNIKIAHLAQALGTSEYIVSKAIRLHFKAPNFNQFINHYRIEHAKILLLKPENHHWSILVIALESGFSSVGTFNRVFKSMLGHMPSEFRKQAAEPAMPSVHV